MDNKAYRQKLADSGQTADQWHRSSSTWFDGSVESVDHRLAMCNLLLARSEEALAKDLGNHKHLAAVVDLQSSQAHLRGLRRDLLTASTDKEAAGEYEEALAREHGLTFPEPDERFVGEWAKARRQKNEPHFSDPSHPLDPAGHPIHEADRRYVELEGARFYRDNPDTTIGELLIRAKNHAELQTSTFSSPRSQAVTTAFVNKVASLRDSAPRPRVASAPPRTPDLPDEFMFI